MNIHPIKSLLKHYQYLALIGVVIIGATLRLIGIQWDDNAHLHPDERFLTMVATGISWPQNTLDYFNTHISPLNPHNKGFSFYVYGTYPVHFVKLVADVLHKDNYDQLPIIGRYMSTIADLITLILVYLLASYISKNKTAGLFAALCYAAAVLPIQISHFFTVDPYATLFGTLTVYRISQGKFGWITGMIVALAIGAKISMIFIIPIVGVALLIYLPAREKSTRHYRTLLHILKTGIVICISCIVTLRFVYPYLFDGWTLNEYILGNWRQLSSFDGPTTSFPPGIQWIGVRQYQLVLDMVIWGLGIPLGIFALLSVAYYFLKALRNTSTKIVLIPLAWILIVMIYQSLQFAKPMRYLLPIYPTICVMSGMFLFTIYQRISHKIHLRYFVILLLCLLLPWPLAFISIYTHQNTRIAASTWIYTHIPKNSTIAWEHWDDPLPLSVGSNTINTYKTVQLPMYNPDSQEKWASLSKTLATTDYIVLSSNRVYGGTSRAIHRYPYTSIYYTKLFRGLLGFTKIAEFTSRPRLMLPTRPICISIPGFMYGFVAHDNTCTTPGIHIVDDYAEESFTVYDHPKIIILQNTQYLSSDTIFTRIYE